MRVKRRQDDGTLEVQMAPLIDCVFLLLVFFLVATTMKKKEREIQVTLPSSSTALFTEQGLNQIAIGVNIDGDFYLNGDKIGREALKSKLREEAFKEHPPRVRIDADQDAKYVHLVEILDLCQFEGLQTVGFRMAKGLTE